MYSGELRGQWLVLSQGRGARERLWETKGPDDSAFLPLVAGQSRGEVKTSPEHDEDVPRSDTGRRRAPFT